MSEKPFWEGKTCEEMANLHVKVTFVAGAVLTGITDCSGHIRRSRNGSVVPISANRGAERFVPYRDIESIELLDDPEYERIDSIEDVREGDEVFTLSGNKYKARAVYGSMEVYADGDGFSPIIQRKYFAYALRRKPKLPDDSHVESYFVVEGLGNSNLITQAYDTYEEAFNSIKYLGPGRYEINKRFRVTKEAEV